jgi:hypothetical protein
MSCPNRGAAGNDVSRKRAFGSFVYDREYLGLLTASTKKGKPDKEEDRERSRSREPKKNKYLFNRFEPTDDDETILTNKPKVIPTAYKEIALKEFEKVTLIPCMEDQVRAEAASGKQLYRKSSRTVVKKALASDYLTEDDAWAIKIKADKILKKDTRAAYGYYVKALDALMPILKVMNENGGDASTPYLNDLDQMKELMATTESLKESLSKGQSHNRHHRCGRQGQRLRSRLRHPDVRRRWHTPPPTTSRSSLTRSKKQASSRGRAEQALRRRKGEAAEYLESTRKEMCEDE